MATTEFNFDGLVGPTHNYAGLSHGNVASISHQHAVSSPRAAAIQGLEKMKFVRDLGIAQAVLPPLQRPNLSFLRHIGFTGSDAQLIEKAHRTDPVLVAICYSASNMWTANAATVSPSADTQDGRLHLTPANLASNLHRAIEAESTTAVLKSIFADEEHFAVHQPLRSAMALTDEGAANHTRLCSNFDQAGLELFVYGCEFLNRNRPRPKKFPARQTLESSQALARGHELTPDQFMLIQQNPDAIDAGVFHNDVISVGHQNILLCHQYAFVDQEKTIAAIENQFKQLCNQELIVISFSNSELPIQDAVSSYLFNNQIVTKPDGKMALICPTNCEQNAHAKSCTQKIVDHDNPINEVHFLDLQQSMNNGGGPACLRLRVAMNEDQQSAMHQKVQLTDDLFDSLKAWVEKHYREVLSPDDLLDPKLIRETRDAFEALASLLEFPINDF